MLSKYFRHPEGAHVELLALTYTFLAYIGGLSLVLLDSLLANAIGTVLLAHSMIISTYYLHELMHSSTFRSPAHTRLFARVFCWITGSYANFDAIRRAHLYHHVNGTDVLSFDYKAFVRSRPLIKHCVLALEWMYVPAVEFIMRGHVIVRPFLDRETDQATRVAIWLVVRVGLLAGLAFVSLKAFALYWLAYIGFLTFDRLVESFHHTYACFIACEGAKPPAQRLDSAYEYANTFSNMISTRWPALNLLLLNFGYHNAHHVKSKEPWYRLPALHRELYGENCPQVVLLRDLLRDFHKYRVTRVIDVGYGQVGEEPNRADTTHYGAVGVSILY